MFLNKIFPIQVFISNCLSSNYCMYHTVLDIKYKQAFTCTQYIFIQFCSSHSRNDLLFAIIYTCMQACVCEQVFNIYVCVEVHWLGLHQLETNQNLLEQLISIKNGPPPDCLSGNLWGIFMVTELRGRAQFTVGGATSG